MGSEFKKKKMLAAATSSPLLRTAAIFLTWQVTGSHKSQLTPHKGWGPHTKRLQWASLTKHIYELLFPSLL